MNTAVSFVTNTSCAGLRGRNDPQLFWPDGGHHGPILPLSGKAVAIALVRGFARRSSETIGNAWVDLSRATLYILMPISIVGALFLASQGVPQTLSGPVNATTLEGAAQTLARGPVASQETIKLMSGDGAVSSTQIRHIHSRIQPHSPTYSRCC
jgi:K+-transporting ATPase ATPase A chain